MQPNPSSNRPGSSLCEVLVALTLVSAVAAVALSATATAERAVGQARYERAALHRAALALATLQAAPCDSSIAVHTIIEPRWQVTSWRDARGAVRRDRVSLRTSRGETISRRLSGWCA